jgi:hypothetical protein
MPSHGTQFKSEHKSGHHGLIPPAPTPNSVRSEIAIGVFSGSGGGSAGVSTMNVAAGVVLLALVNRRGVNWERSRVDLSALARARTDTRIDLGSRETIRRQQAF